MVTPLGTLSVTRYLVHVFQRAFWSGNSPVPSTSIGPSFSKSRPQCAMSPCCPIQSSNWPPPLAGLPDMLILLHRFHDVLLLGNRAIQRFLAENILFLFARFGGGERVPMIRNRDHHRIDVFAREHLAIIVIGFAVLVLVFL